MTDVSEAEINEARIQQIADNNVFQIEQFKRNLIERRIQTGLSIETVATRMGVLPEDVIAFEHYSSNPHFSTIKRYATAIEVMYTIGLVL